MLCASRQRAHLISHHGEAASLFTGTGRFNGRIQGQQVGLLSNITDHVDHRTDLIRIGIQAGDDLSRAIDVICQAVDRVDGLFHHRLAVDGFTVRFTRRFRRLRGAARDLLHGRCHLMNGRRSLRGFTLLHVGVFMGARDHLFHRLR